MAEGVKKKRRKSRGLQWTEAQKATAALYSQGKSFDEVVATGITKNMAQRVRVALDKGQKPEGWVEGVPQQALEVRPTTAPREAPKKPEATPQGPPQSAFQMKYRIDTTEPVTIGAIQVLPEDWRISQHGTFLILDTFYLTKEELGYDGSIGEFMVDIFRFYRQFMQYAVLRDVGPQFAQQGAKEVSDNGNERGEEADTGAGIHEEGDKSGLGQAGGG